MWIPKYCIRSELIFILDLNALMAQQLFQEEDLGDVPKNKLCFAIKLSKFDFVYDTCCQRRVSLIICCKFWLYSFFYKHTGKLGWSSICSRFFFPNLSQNLCLMVCLSSKLISWSNIAFDMNTAMVSLTFEILWVA